MKEFIRKYSERDKVAILGNKAVSYRCVKEESLTARVYRDGKIGVVGVIGGGNEEELYGKAEKMLSFGIDYPEIPSAPAVKSVSQGKADVEASQLFGKTEELLDGLITACPNFSFNQSLVMLHKSTEEYKNDCGRHLTYSDEMINSTIIIKDKASANIFDLFIDACQTEFNPKEIIENVAMLHDIYHKKTSIEAGYYPVIIQEQEFFSPFSSHFEGRQYASGGSLLSGKLGQRIFNDKLNVYCDYNEKVNPAVFFDAEGEFSEDLKSYFIKDGVLTGLLTNKKIAAKYNLPACGFAAAGYDAVPGVNVRSAICLDNDDKLLSKISGKAIYAYVTSGGDMTATGNFATPVMIAFLVEDGKIVGTIDKDLNVSGNVFDVLGKDYIGAFNKGARINPDQCLVATMKVSF